MNRMLAIVCVVASISGAQVVEDTRLTGETPGDRFGERVGLTGNDAFVSVPGSNEVRIFRRVEGWSLLQTLTSSDPGVFGSDLDVDGDIAVIGDDRAWVDGIRRAGRAHVYRRDGDWQADGDLVGPGTQDLFFGNAVAIHGDVAVVGTLGVQPRGVYVYRHDGSSWQFESQLRSPNEQFLIDNFQNESFGLSVAAFDDRIVVGAPFFPFDDQGELAPACGIAYAFRFEDGVWVPEASFQFQGARAGDRFGFDLDLVQNAVAIGGPGRNGDEFTGEGAIGFASFDEAWGPVTEINPPSRDAVLNEAALFGSSVALTEHFGRLAILGGAPNAEIRGRGLAGVCYWFEQLSTADWTFAGKLQSSFPVNADGLGATVATDGEQAICGLPLGGDGKGQLVGAAVLYGTPGFRQAVEWLGNDGSFDDPTQWDGGRTPDAGTTVVMAAGGRMAFGADATVNALAIPKGVGSIEPGGSRLDATGGVLLAGASTMFGVTGPGILATNRIESIDATMMLVDTTLEGNDVDVQLNRGTLMMTDTSVDATSLRFGATLRGDVSIEASSVASAVSVGKGVRLELTDSLIQGDVQNTGEVVVSGASTIDGSCSLVGPDEAGSLRFRIGLNGDDPTFDSLQISGDCALAGSLTIELEGVAGTFREGQRFPILSSGGTMSGVFDIAYMPGIGSDLLLTLEQTEGPGGGLEVVVTSLSTLLGFASNPDNDEVGAGSMAALDLRDIDADGDPDLAITVPSNDQVLIILNSGVDQGTWLGFDVAGVIVLGLPAETGPADVAIADLFGPTGEMLDIAICNVASADVQVFRNLQEEPLQFVRETILPVSSFRSNPRTISATRFDLEEGDGLDDLAVTWEGDLDDQNPSDSREGNVSFLMNNGGGGFEICDFDTDPGDGPSSGDPLRITSGRGGGQNGFAAVYPNSDTVRVFTYTGSDPMFIVSIYPVAGGPIEVLGADINGDGLDEIVTANSLDATVSVLRNLDSVFGPAVALDADGQAASLGAVDVQNDAKTDIVYVLDGDVAMIRNVAPEPGGLAFLEPELIQITGDASRLEVGDVDMDDQDDLVVLVDDGPPGPSNLVDDLTVALNEVCRADLVIDGILDIFDVLAFLDLFQQEAPIADWNRDGIWNIFDVIAYLSSLDEGC